MGFPHPDWEVKPGLYRHDLRSPGAGGYRWQIEVTSHEPGEEVAIEPLAEGSLPEELALRLVDEELGTALDLRGADGAPQAYQFLSAGPDRPYRLTLLAGTQAWVGEEMSRLVQVPAQFLLGQNAPNPFNGATRILFGLPQSAEVTFEIFDVRGERLASLLRAKPFPPGYHTVLWNGTDAAGRPVSSGLYFYRLTDGPRSLTKRLVLLK